MERSCLLLPPKNQFQARAAACFHERMADMTLDGSDADHRGLSHGFVAHAVAQKLNHIDLGLGEVG